MRMPDAMPATFRRTDSPAHSMTFPHERITLQGLFDFLPGIGDTVKCAACCAGKAGFGACVARCLATGQACDGGLNNCSPC